MEDDYKLFDLDNLEKYNKKYIEEKFKNMLKCIKEEECKYICGASLNRNTTIRYEQLTFNRSDPTARLAIERIESEEDLLEAYTLLKKIFDLSLCYVEKIIFVDYFLLKKTRDNVEERLHIGNDKFYQIKNSCLLKFALALNWKDILMNDNMKELP